VIVVVKMSTSEIEIKNNGGDGDNDGPQTREHEREIKVECEKVYSFSTYNRNKFYYADDGEEVEDLALIGKFYECEARPFADDEGRGWVELHLPHVYFDARLGELFGDIPTWTRVPGHGVQTRKPAIDDVWKIRIEDLDEVRRRWEETFGEGTFHLRTVEYGDIERLFEEHERFLAELNEEALKAVATGSAEALERVEREFRARRPDRHKFKLVVNRYLSLPDEFITASKARVKAVYRQYGETEKKIDEAFKKIAELIEQFAADELRREYEEKLESREADIEDAAPEASPSDKVIRALIEERERFAKFVVAVARRYKMAKKAVLQYIGMLPDDVAEEVKKAIGGGDE